MRCPTLKELPPPPSGKTGWPWIEESPQLPETMPDGSLWPKISIVTPSLNQVQFLEETIRSVLLQGYPDLEYLIIDGGSRDDSIDIIKKYEQWLYFWISEPDTGQTEAINKGLKIITGKIFGWLNSDDLYLPGALPSVAVAFLYNPNDIIAGNVVNINNETGEEHLIEQHNIYLENLIKFWGGMGISHHSHTWHQPGLFIPSKYVNMIGLLDERLTYAMDYDYLCRLLKNANVAYQPEVFAKFRIHKDSKTKLKYSNFIIEKVSIFRRYRNLLNESDKTNAELATFLVMTVSHQLRSLYFKTPIKLLFSSWQATRKHTLYAIFKEIKRLILGGKYTGGIY